jgi:hypothetical protein
MKKSKATKIIEKIAIRERISVTEVRESMQEAIDIAYENRDESSESFWSRWNGSPPSPDEFLTVVSKEVLGKLSMGNKK